MTQGTGGLSDWTVKVKGEITAWYEALGVSEESAAQDANRMFRKELDEDLVGGVLDEDTVSVVEITSNQKARWGWLVEIKGEVTVRYGTKAVTEEEATEDAKFMFIDDVGMLDSSYVDEDLVEVVKATRDEETRKE